MHAGDEDHALPGFFLFRNLVKPSEMPRPLALEMLIQHCWMDNIKTWTGLPVEESIRMTEDRDKWIKYVHGVANLRIEDG